MNSNLSNKLQQYSAAPPEGVWDKIADALDETGNFAERLYQYEEMPSANNWGNITQKLTEPAKSATVVPMRKRLSTPLRYAIVASLLAITLVTITLTIKRTRAGELEAENNATVAPAKEAPITAGVSKRKQSEAAPRSTTSNSRVINLNPKTTGLATDDKTDKVSFDTPQPTEQRSRLSNTVSLNHYVTFSDDEGNLLKVSKKIASMVNCKDSDRACKERLRQLRQKMATNAMTTDFTGILEMLQQLQ